ncbi:MAG TPA: sulfotransferase domain-containing protein [Rhizomicrobium sp.]|nr:sulfotransferase domain-containing protein [Rhizomicrobium sp.]
MRSYALIATHHKTGSVWMRTVFRAIGRALGVPFINPNRKLSLDRDAPPEAGIIFSDHSDFSSCARLLDHPRSRIMHIIRDPRDVLISAMHYHRHAKETWLHAPRKGLGGMSYQEKLNRLRDDQSRYIFEMERSSMRVISDMQKWNYQRTNSFECKYEELIADEEMEIVSKLLTHLGFEDHELEMCRGIFWENSLFGKLKGSQSTHIRSGALRQWPTVFDTSLAAAFLERFPDALVRLGYESDNSWADEIAHRSAAGTDMNRSQAAETETPSMAQR